MLQVSSGTGAAVTRSFASHGGMQPLGGLLSPKVMPASTEASDRSLVERFLNGSETAFRQLYRRHTPRIRGSVVRLLGADADADADDVVQECWLRACAAFERFRWDSALSTWLCGIGIHAALEVLRRRDRWADDDEALARAPARGPAAGERLDVASALAILPAGQRTVVVLHDVEGYTHEEIAMLLGVVPGTSKSQLAHARAALREALR